MGKVRTVAKLPVVGKKVRVYDARGKVFGHGVVIGHNERGRIILESHPEFGSLSIHEIDITRLYNEVEFLNK